MPKKVVEWVRESNVHHLARAVDPKVLEKAFAALSVFCLSGSRLDGASLFEESVPAILRWPRQIDWIEEEEIVTEKLTLAVRVSDE